jgi:hypothetical protein
MTATRSARGEPAHNVRGFRARMAARTVAGIAFLLVLEADPAWAPSVPCMSIEWLTVSNSDIAIYRVTAVRDSASAPPTSMLKLDLALRLERTIRGTAPDTIHLVDWVMPSFPHLMPNGRIVVLGCGIPKRWEEGQADEHGRFATCVSLTPGFQFEEALAIDRGFHVLQNPDSILAAIQERMTLIRAGRPLGDNRPVEPAGELGRRGSLTFWMPEESEAQKETWVGSYNTLTVPADAAYRPFLLELAKSTEPQPRLQAAYMLREYPGRDTERALKKLLGDYAGFRVETITAGRDTVISRRYIPWVAWRSLEVLGVHAPRPIGTSMEEELADLEGGIGGALLIPER